MSNILKLGNFSDRCNKMGLILKSGKLKGYGTRSTSRVIICMEVLVRTYVSKYQSIT